MIKKDQIKLFEDSKIRTVWDSDKEKWYISIVDVRHDNFLGQKNCTSNVNELPEGW